MASEFYDFSLETIANPATPPSGLRSWTYASGQGKIDDTGYTRSTLTSAWVSSGFVPSGNFIKIETVLGSDAQGLGGGQGAGFFLSANDLASDDDGVAMFLGTQIYKEITLNGSTMGLTGINHQVPSIVSGETYALYVDKVNNKAYPYRNGGGTFRPINIPITVVTFGLMSSSAGIFKSLKIEDVAEIPNYVGNISSLDAGSTVTNRFELTKLNSALYAGDRPKFASFNGFPVVLSNFTNTTFDMEFIGFDKILGNSFSVPIAANANAPAVISFSSYSETWTSYAALWSGQTNPKKTITPTFGSDNINSYYTINGSVTGMPVDSLIFIGSPPTTYNDLPSISTNGVAILTALSDNIGTKAITLYIQDGIDLKLRKFIATFNKASPDFGKLVNLVEVPYYFSNNFNVAINATADSNAVSIDNADGLSFYVEGGGLLSYDTGSGYTGWLESSVGSPVVVSSSLNPVPFKLRGVASNISLVERVFSLREVTLPINYSWSVFSHLDPTIFVPNLMDTPEETVIALINHENNTNFQVNDVDIINPTSYTGIKSGNTNATVTAEADSGFNGSIGVNYSRLDLVDFVGGSTASIDVPVGEAWADVIAEFNGVYGTNLIEEDYEPNPSYIKPELGTITTSVEAKATSLVYIGEVTLDVVGPVFDIDEYIPEDEIGGL